MDDMNIPQPPAARRPRRRRPLNMVVNGALASVGNLYLATESIAVTAIGAAVAVFLVALYLLGER